MIKERVSALQNLLKEKNISALIIPTDDFHMSEYVGDYFKARNYFSGFTGSAGVMVVAQDEANLWVDGRYFIQAEKQLENTGIIPKYGIIAGTSVPRLVSPYMKNPCRLLSYIERNTAGSFLIG